MEARQASLSELEEARSGGASIEKRDFRLAVDLVAGAVRETGLAELSGTKLLGSRSRKPVSPRTPHQLEYVKAMRTIPVVFGVGPAGTGKTYLAMAMALSMLKEGEITRVVLTRPAVEAGEALGFLPGTCRRRSPRICGRSTMRCTTFSSPTRDIATWRTAQSRSRRWPTCGAARLARSFVILDEAQNTTREQMFMLLTRLGEGSRCVVTGDGTQVDLREGTPPD